MLFGPGRDGEPTAQDWADAVGTIHYEIVTRVGPRVHARLPRRRRGPMHGPGRPGSRRRRTASPAADAPRTPARSGCGWPACCAAGDLVVLSGPLGAGKTALVQGIGAGLDVQGRIASPTFVIARVHPARAEGGVPLVHVDAYRLGSLDEVDDLDLDVDAQSSVTVVEWGAGLVEQLAESHLTITLHAGRGLRSRGPRCSSRTAATGRARRPRAG